MYSIYHSFPIRASASSVFECISTSNGIDMWWTKSSMGIFEIDHPITLFFGAGYNWEAIVTKFGADSTFEIELTNASTDWLGTKVGFVLNQKNDITHVDFYHSGWNHEDEHFKITSFCWAMYLRLLKRFLEFGDLVPYEERLNE